MGSLSLAMALVAGLVPSAMEVEHDGVRVRVDVHSQVYRWEVTNLSRESIVGFEVGQHHGYNFLAPEGWVAEFDAASFRATTDVGYRALYRDATREFSQRVSSSGAVLGLVNVTLRTVQGETIEIPGVWGPVPESWSTIAVVPVVLALIAIIQTWVGLRRSRSTGITF